MIDPGVSFAERKARLLFDSLWIAVLGLALTWGVSSYQASISYLLGAGLGFGYVTLLSRFVESLGRGGPGERPQEEGREARGYVLKKEA